MSSGESMSAIGPVEYSCLALDRSYHVFWLFIIVLLVPNKFVIFFTQTFSSSCCCCRSNFCLSSVILLSSFPSLAAHSSFSIKGGRCLVKNEPGLLHIDGSQSLVDFSPQYSQDDDSGYGQTFCICSSCSSPS